METVRVLSYRAGRSRPGQGLRGSMLDLTLSYALLAGVLIVYGAQI